MRIFDNELRELRRIFDEYNLQRENKKYSLESCITQKETIIFSDLFVKDKSGCVMYHLYTSGYYCERQIQSYILLLEFLHFRFIISRHNYNRFKYQLPNRFSRQEILVKFVECV